MDIWREPKKQKCKRSKIQNGCNYPHRYRNSWRLMEVVWGGGIVSSSYMTVSWKKAKNNIQLFSHWPDGKTHWLEIITNILLISVIKKLADMMSPLDFSYRAGEKLHMEIKVLRFELFAWSCEKERRTSLSSLLCIFAGSAVPLVLPFTHSKFHRNNCKIHVCEI